VTGGPPAVPPPISALNPGMLRSHLMVGDPVWPVPCSRCHHLLLLSAVIATAGVVSDSTAIVIGAMIIAPLMTPSWGPAHPRHHRPAHVPSSALASLDLWRGGFS
jgi:hypothetical protein